MDLVNSNLIFDLFCVNKTLLCKICDKYLTVSPIYEVADIGRICGRCTSKIKEHSKFKNKSEYKQQTSAEALFKNCNVPCCNRMHGCNKVLKWNTNVIQHETVCNYKKVTCPLVYGDVGEENCTWSGNCKQFVQHVEEQHKAVITTNGDENGSGDVTLLESSTNNTVQPISVVKKKRSTYDKVLLKTCICWRCSDYMVTGRIYTNSRGDNICSKCFYKKKHPSFKRHACNNTALRAIISVTNLPCRRKNCKFSCVGQFIQTHEVVCKFAKIKCKFDNCGVVIVRKNLEHHLQHKHINLLIRENRLSHLNIETLKLHWKWNYICFDNNVFRLCRKIGLVRLSAAIYDQPCSTPKNDTKKIDFILSCENDVGDAKYNYVLEFFNPDYPDLVATLLGACGYYVDDKKNGFCNKCSLTPNMLKYLGCQNILKYKIQILKV